MHLIISSYHWKLLIIDSVLSALKILINQLALHLNWKFRWTLLGLQVGRTATNDLLLPHKHFKRRRHQNNFSSDFINIKSSAMRNAIQLKLHTCQQFLVTCSTAGAGA